MTSTASTSTAVHPIDPAIEAAEEKPRKKGSGRPKGSKDKPRAPGAPRRGRPPNAIKAAMALAGGSQPTNASASATRPPKISKGKKVTKGKATIDKKSVLALFEQWRQTQSAMVPKTVLPHLEKFLTFVEQSESGAVEDDGHGQTTDLNVFKGIDSNIDPNIG